MVQSTQEIKLGFGREGIKLVAVSKTKPADQIMNIYHQGHRIFGENRAPELIEKAKELPEDIQWHMIGHLQRNKVKGLIPYVSMIHSIDSVRLIKEVNKHATNLQRIIPCLLQIKIGKEEAKSGFEFGELTEWLQKGEWKELSNIRLDGVMGMASFISDMEIVREEFRFLKQCFTYLKTHFFQADQYFNEISMGMSGDYRVAIEEGSTMVRIGSLIFGAR